MAVLAPKIDPVEIKDMTTFLLDNGLLFEMNRNFLHPLGLFLIVQEKEYGDGVELTLFQSPPDAPPTFPASTFVKGKDKWLKFWNSHGRAALAKRKEILGISTQTHPDYKTQPTRV